MEVHPHHHVHQGKKKKTDYLWEFLMLFLAVFSGFLAENFREHIVDRKREKVYIRSLVKDLTTDTTWFNSYMSDQRAAVRDMDSVILLLRTGSSDSFSRKRIYYLARMAIKLSSPNKINYSAYDQMRSSGNLRLIREQGTTDSITRYYFSANDILQMNETVMQRQASLVEFEGKILDGNVLQSMENAETFEFREPEGNPALATSDKILINDFIVRAHYLISINALSSISAQQQKETAIRLINYLKNEYHFK